MRDLVESHFEPIVSLCEGSTSRRQGSLALFNERRHNRFNFQAGRMSIPRPVVYAGSFPTFVLIQGIKEDVKRKRERERETKKERRKRKIPFPPRLLSAL